MKGEFYKFDFEAWDEGTVDLTLEQEAAYLRVCNNLYRRGGAFPNSERLLCSLWRCHPNKAKSLLKALVDSGKIRVADGVITNKRASEEIADRAKISGVRAEAGRTGGIRSGETRRTPEAHVSDTLPTLTEHPGHTSATPTKNASPKSLLSQDAGEANASKQTNQIREEKKREDRSSLRSDHTSDDPKSILGSVLSAETVVDLLAHRKAAKSPITAGAAKGLAKAFVAYGDPEGAAQAMMANGWRGFKPEWMGVQARAGPARNPAGRSVADLAMMHDDDHPEMFDEPGSHHTNRTDEDAEPADQGRSGFAGRLSESAAASARRGALVDH